MNKTLIIAEAGVNHNGDMNTARKLCSAAKDSGADVVKFQTFSADLLTTNTVAQASYQSENLGKVESQYDMLKRLELSYDEFRELKKYCDAIGIVFNSTPFDKMSLDFLVDLGISFIKISSGDITNIPFIRYIGQKKLPVVLSTGMSHLSDVDIAVRTLQESYATEITLLHCTTDYPCPHDTVNLRAMNTLSSAFHLPVGYSDHTKGIEIPIAAVSLGATVIEKHFTLDHSMEGPDQKASTEPEEFARMVDAVRNVEKALGSGLKVPSSNEKEIAKIVLKRMLASRDILLGETILPDMVSLKRNDVGIPAQMWDCVIGAKAWKHFFKGEPIVL